MTPRRHTARPPSLVRDDCGASLVMAVIVMVVLSTLTLALLGRTLSVMTTIRHGQDFDAALAVADAGLSDALFAIDQTAPPDFTRSDRDPLDPQDNSYFDYFADKVSDKEYVVTSVGNEGRSRHAIEAVVRRGAMFPYAIFSDQPLHFDGNIASPAMRIQFYTFNRLPGDPDIVRIGSNNHVVCNGPVDPNVYIDEFSGHGNCDTTHLTTMDEPRDLSYKLPPGPYQSCPVGGVFGGLGSTASSPAFIDGAGGAFICQQNVTLLGFIEVINGPVQIYILPTLDAQGNPVADYSLDMSAAVVNTTAGASQFQIYKEGAAPINIGAGNTSGTMTFRGVLFAPDSRLTVNGGLWWTGSVTVNELTINGAPNLTFGYDYDLAHYLGNDWKVARYRETTPGTAAALVQAAMPTTTLPPLP